MVSTPQGRRGGCREAPPGSPWPRGRAGGGRRPGARAPPQPSCARVHLAGRAGGRGGEGRGPGTPPLRGHSGAPAAGAQRRLSHSGSAAVLCRRRG